MIGVAAVALAAGVCGHALVSRWGPGGPLPERLAWAWVAGQGTLSLSAALVLALGGPLELALLPPALAAATAWRAGASRARSGALAPGAAVSGVGAAASVAAFTSAWLTPGLGWDGLAIWGLKAKTLADTGTLSLAAMQHPSALPSHPEYPLHVPLLGGLAGRLDAGGFDERTLPLLAALDFAAIAWILLLALARRLPGVWAGACAAGGLLVPLAWSELAEGKADLSVALCLLAAVVAFGRWLESEGAESEGWLALGAIAAGLAAWSKQEGLVWCALLWALVLALTPAGRRRIALRAAWLSAAWALPWHVVRLLVGLGTEPFALGAGAPARLPAIAGALVREAIGLETWSLLWALAAAALALLLSTAPRRRSDLLAASSLAGGILAVAGFFVASPHDLEWHLGTALSRLLLQWWPVASLVIGAALSLRLAEKGEDSG
ncbi:MAG: hypothetical protein AAF725_19865 [Acidobacteriota bacterium]